MKYYTNSGDEVLKELNSSLNGLTNGEATNRLNKYGYNELEQKKEKNTFKDDCFTIKRCHDHNFIYRCFNFISFKRNC